MNEKYYTIKQVMQNYNVSRSSVYRRMKEKGVDPVKISNRSVRLREDQIKELFKTS
jgi:predicted DNA-binding transcriptional regulator AlpA